MTTDTEAREKAWEREVTNLLGLTDSEKAFAYLGFILGWNADLTAARERDTVTTVDCPNCGPVYATPGSVAFCQNPAFRPSGDER